MPIYCLAVYRAIRMCAKKVTRALPSYLEFHGMSAVTYGVKVICIGESKKRLEGMLRLFSVFGRLFFSILSQKIS